MQSGAEPPEAALPTREKRRTNLFAGLLSRFISKEEIHAGNKRY